MAERDGKGQFVAGNPGGPGRPRARMEGAVDAALIGRLARLGQMDGDGAALWWTAQALKDWEEWTVRVRDSFSPAVVARVDEMLQLAELARGIESLRMKKELRALLDG